MDIPAVEQHDVALSFADVIAVCEQRVAEANRPCATVKIDDKVCFAFLDFEGNSTTVHCFINREAK